VHANFYYNGEGERVKAVTTVREWAYAIWPHIGLNWGYSSSTTTNYFIWSGGKVIYEVRGDNQPRDFIYGLGEKLVSAYDYDDGGGQQQQMMMFQEEQEQQEEEEEAVGDPPFEPEGGGGGSTCYTRLRYYVNDMYGSVRGITNESTVVAKLEYYPYGEVYSMSGGGSAYTFLGKEDPGVGMLDFGPRYYNAMLGRFLSPDPMLAGASAYSYAEGNPVMLYDPSGMYALPPPPPSHDSPDFLARLDKWQQGPYSSGNLPPGTYMVNGDYVQIGYTNGRQAYEDLPYGSDARDACDRQTRVNTIFQGALEDRRHAEATANVALGYGQQQRAAQAARNGQQKKETGGPPVAGMPSDETLAQWADEAEAFAEAQTGGPMLAWNPKNEKVTEEGLSPEICEIETIVDGVYNDVVGRDATVTSTRYDDNSHTGKAHYRGDAVDIRTMGLSDSQVHDVLNGLSSRIPSTYYFQFEEKRVENRKVTHIHIQYQRGR